MSKLRVLLADDHAPVRAGLRALLRDLPDVEVTAETGDGLEALRLICETRPDLALIDISMPGLNGLEVAARAGKEQPQTRIVILSLHPDEQFVRCALEAGAAGYLLKDSARSELQRAIEVVAGGGVWLSARLEKIAAPAAPQPEEPP